MQPMWVTDDLLQIREEDYKSVLAKCDVTDKIALDSVASIKEWYKMQHHFPEEIFHDSQLFCILLANNFSLERTKQKIDNLLTARNLLPEIMSNCDPHSEHIQTALQYFVCGVIPKYLDDMTRIVILGFKSGDASKFNFPDFQRVYGIGINYLAFSDICLGYHYIVDWSGMKSGHITQMNPGLLQKGLFVIKECYGTKIKSIHIINTPASAKWIFAIVKTCLSDKISSRFYIHKNHEELYNFFPKNLLPSDFGGENKSLEEFTQDCNKRTFERRDDILKMDLLKSDESKRIGVGSAISKELQGMKGSFRTLDID